MKPRSSLCSISLRELKAILPLVNFKVSSVKFLKDKLVVSREAQPGGTRTQTRLVPHSETHAGLGALWIDTQPSPVPLERINPGPASGVLWLSESPFEDLPRTDQEEPILLDCVTWNICAFLSPLVCLSPFPGPFHSLLP